MVVSFLCQALSEECNNDFETKGDIRMNRPAGFVPANYRLTGKILLILGGIGLLAAGVGALTGWFELPRAVFIVSLVAIPVSLYLLFVPKEE